MMVWYTAKSHNPEIIGQNFICGIILNLNTQTLTTFILYPSDGGVGITPYWAILRTKGEIPTSMITEVEELTEEEITVILPWEGRPVRIKVSFETGAMEYSEVDNTEHRRWINSGFDKVPFASLHQEFKGQPESQYDSEGQAPYDCSQHDGDQEGCAGGSAYMMEVSGSWRFDSSTQDLEKHSNYSVTIFDEVFTSDSDNFYISDFEACNSVIRKCQYSYDDSCDSHTTVLDKSLQVTVDLDRKTNDSIYASWLNPNIAFKLATQDRNYLDGTAGFSGYLFGGPTSSDFSDPCRWDRAEFYREFVSFFCFHDLAKMPMDCWNDMGNEYYNEYGGFRNLVRESHDDVSDSVYINEYVVDGKIALDSTETDRLYYLDDRATDDNQGIIVAGKSNSEEKLSDTEYIPDSWSINWKVDWNDKDRSLQGCKILDDDIEYIDIKDKLLEVLNCEVYELFDIGLV